MGRLSGKVVYITGGSSGIGEAIAHAFAKEGASLVIVARRIQLLEHVRQDIERNYPNVKVLTAQVDVTKREQVKQSVQQAERTIGPIDILINNAGVFPLNLMKNLKEDEWDMTIDINCKGVLNGIAAVLPNMMARKTGIIVNISSDAGKKVFPGLTVYSGTKHFVEAVTIGLRQEMVPYNIKVVFFFFFVILI